MRRLLRVCLRAPRLACNRLLHTDAGRPRIFSPVESPQPPRVHTNAMAAVGGPFDVTLDFGYRANPADEPEVAVRVTMSWEHVLSMVKALQVMVDSYEQQIGGKLRDLDSLKEETS